VLTVPIAALGAKLNTWTYRWMAAWSKWDWETTNYLFSPPLFSFV
jgi:hypothetical protein